MKATKRMIRKLFASRGIDLDALRPRKEYVIDQKRLMPDPKVIFDVGGHMGQTVEKYQKLYPDAVIHSFEPFKFSFDHLSEACRPEGKCYPHMLAFSNAPGEAAYFANAHGGGTNSLFPPEDMEKRFDHDDDEHYAGTVRTSVVTDTIDAFCERERIERIDILKMDIQGGELLALAGATRMLSEEGVGLIFLEVSFIPIYKGQALFHEIEEFLVGHGYTLYNIHYLSTQSQGQIVQGDAIFVNRDLARRYALDTAVKGGTLE